MTLYIGSEYGYLFMDYAKPQQSCLSFFSGGGKATRVLKELEMLIGNSTDYNFPQMIKEWKAFNRNCK